MYTIDETIQMLEEIKEKHGNIKVRVQYRDGGGDYYGTGELEWIDVDDSHTSSDDSCKLIDETFVVIH